MSESPVGADQPPVVEQNNVPLLLEIEEEDYEKLKQLIEEMKTISANLSDYILNNLKAVQGVEVGRYYFRSRVSTFAIIEKSVAELQDRINRVKAAVGKKE